MGNRATVTQHMHATRGAERATGGTRSPPAGCVWKRSLSATRERDSSMYWPIIQSETIRVTHTTWFASDSLPHCNRFKIRSAVGTASLRRSGEVALAYQSWDTETLSEIGHSNTRLSRLQSVRSTSSSSWSRSASLLTSQRMKRITQQCRNNCLQRQNQVDCACTKLVASLLGRVASHSILLPNVGMGI